MSTYAKVGDTVEFEVMTKKRGVVDAADAYGLVLDDGTFTAQGRDVRILKRAHPKVGTLMTPREIGSYDFPHGTVIGFEVRWPSPVYRVLGADGLWYNTQNMLAGKAYPAHTLTYDYTLVFDPAAGK